MTTSTAQRGLTFQGIVRKHRQGFLEAHPHLDFEHLNALESIRICKTIKCGGRVETCEKPECGHRWPWYLSCGNRLCNMCGREDKEKWVETQVSRLLPGVRLFHTVSKLPGELALLAIGDNKKAALKTLFTATKEALLKVSEERLGARIGFVSVLETAAGDLSYGPHIHSFGPAIGLAADKSHVRSIHKKTFPESMLETTFREVMIRELLKAHSRGQLNFYGTWEKYRDRDEFKAWIEALSISCRAFESP